MASASRRRPPSRTVLLDRALEALPLFRLSDSSEDTVVNFTADNGVTNFELWKSDGTEAGTKLVVDLWPGGFEGGVSYIGTHWRD